jgi:tetratricopeptide (TPR) repeat protein
LHSVKPRPMPDSIKTDYYALMARAYYDLSGYTQDTYYSSRYIKAGERYVDSALALLNENAMRFYVLRGMKREVNREAEKARADFQTILDKFNPSFNQYAMAANSLGSIYYKRGEIDKAIAMMARAAMADIKGSVKEGVALMNLADFLYHNGEEARAYDYIKQALEDADFYGAKQRKIQVGAILPVIEGERLATVDQQRSRLFIYSLVVTLLSGLVVIFAVIIFRQLKQLRTAKRTVTEAFNKLQETNDKLIEANKIKEEYIGYSFNNYSDYLEKVDKFKKSIDKKLMARQYDDINYVMKTINLKKEREALYQNFDKIFIRLFPNFVPEFNTFFKEEDKIMLKDQDSLTIELRIFALIRLGIHDHEQIARLLDYSVNTIYTYKTRVKNRSAIPNEEFESKIMAIKAF